MKVEMASDSQKAGSSSALAVDDRDGRNIYIYTTVGSDQIGSIGNLGYEKIRNDTKREDRDVFRSA
jgi:hypothetical protein